MSLENLTEDQQAFSDSLEATGIPIDEDGFTEKFKTLADEEGITFSNSSSTSAWGNWLKSIAVKPMVWLVEYMITTIMPGLYLKTAAGMWLDLHGWRLDAERKQKSKALGNITFSRKTNGVTVSIPTGTVVQTASINGKVYQLQTTEDGVLEPEDYSIDIPAEALGVGSAYNLSAGYYVVMETPIDGIDSVANGSAWLTTPGDDDESDETYRERLRGKSSANCDWHINTVYKTLISEFSGVDYDRIYIDETNSPRGAGSADALILFDSGIASDSYINEINTYINDSGYHGLGDDFQVRSIPETQHDLVVTIRVAAGMSDDEKTRLIENFELMVRCAFRENEAYNVTKTWPVSLFSFAQLSKEVMTRYTDIISIRWINDDILNGWDICRLNSIATTVDEVNV